MNVVTTDDIQPVGSVDPASSPGGPLLHGAGIGKSYRMGAAELQVLRDCSLRVDAGEFVAVTGKSGSGKSTLLHILGALDVPQQGQVTFLGQPIFAPPGQRRLGVGVFDVFSSAERLRCRLRRTAFGFVFQFYHLLPDLNVIENVMLTRMVGSSAAGWRRERRAARQEATELLKLVGLEQRLKHKPNELSGGERQRVAIARAWFISRACFSRTSLRAI